MQASTQYIHSFHYFFLIGSFPCWLMLCDFPIILKIFFVPRHPETKLLKKAGVTFKNKNIKLVLLSNTPPAFFYINELIHCLLLSLNCQGTGDRNNFWFLWQSDKYPLTAQVSYRLAMEREGLRRFDYCFYASQYKLRGTIEINQVFSNN